MCAYEQADVDRLTRGIGGIFRRLLADHTDLSRELQELAAAQLQCAELEEELRAIETELSQLGERSTKPSSRASALMISWSGCSSW
jgi:predicted nuclease with TOPRIM domain